MSISKEPAIRADPKTGATISYHHPQILQVARFAKEGNIQSKLLKTSIQWHTSIFGDVESRIDCAQKRQALSKRPGFSTSQDPIGRALQPPLLCHAPQSYRFLLPRSLAKEQKRVLQQESEISRGIAKILERNAKVRLKKPFLRPLFRCG